MELRNHWGQKDGPTLPGILLYPSNHVTISCSERNKEKQQLKDMRIEFSTTHVSTVSSGQNTTASNNVYIQLIDVRGWFGWNMSGFLKSFVGTRIHVSKRLRALLKHSRKK